MRFLPCALLLVSSLMPAQDMRHKAYKLHLLDIGSQKQLSVANYQISLNAVGCEVLLPLPGCATSSSCSFM